MSKIESFVVGSLLGIIPLFFCLVAAVTVGTFSGTITDANGSYFGLGALCAGVMIDVFFLRKWVKRAYQLSTRILASIYVFFSIGVLGICMGVPILNFGVGMLAGIYTERRMYHRNAPADERIRSIKKTSLFTAMVLGLMCCLVGTWALIGGLVGSQFKTPVLSFTFTAPIIVFIVLAGGFVLCLLQYWLTSGSAAITAKILK